MFVFKLSTAELAGEAWLNSAFHPFVQAQRLLPLVRLSAIVAWVDGSRENLVEACKEKHESVFSN